MINTNVPDFEHAAALLDHHRVHEAVPVSQGISIAFSRVPTPNTRPSPALRKPASAEQQSDAQEGQAIRVSGRVAVIQAAVGAAPRDQGGDGKHRG